VRGDDNLSTGRRRFLHNVRDSPSFERREVDLLDLPKLKIAMAGLKLVFSLAADADSIGRILRSLGTRLCTRSRRGERAPRDQETATIAARTTLSI